MTIELTREECEELTKLLEAAQRDLGSEIRRTDATDYRQELKDEKRVLQHLYDRLSAACVG